MIDSSPLIVNQSPIHTLLSRLKRLEERSTPGPYFVERIDHNDGEIAYEINDREQLVAFQEMNFKYPLCAKFNAEFYAEAKNALPSLLKLLEQAVEMAEFYGDPETYFAVGVLGDSPCGEFVEDFDETELGTKPGKRARAFLAEANRIAGELESGG